MRKLRKVTISLFTLVAALMFWQEKANADTSSSIDVSELVKLAEQGDSEAQYLLGNAYFFGNGVPQDIEKAIVWYRDSSNNKFPAAMYTLGTFYLRGTFGVTKSECKGIRLMEDAAEHGVIDAACALTVIYSQNNHLKSNERFSYWSKYLEDKGYSCTYGKMPQ